MRFRTLDDNGKKRVEYFVTCKYCGKSFYSPISFTRCCPSDECRRTQKREANHRERLAKVGKLGYLDKKCKICGKIFSPTTSTACYCSSECRRIGYNINANIKQKQYNKAKKKEPNYIFKRRLLRWIERCVLGKKAKRSYEYVTYSSEDFKRHIESLFVEGMSWDNYGKWHIDHIRPLVSFSFVNADGSVNIDEVRKANSLENLQPLWASDNIRKGGKWNNEV